ncbi:MarR family transcriptional regulator [Actinobacteria bacterium YIM 96077]|uniref:MarR family transcriptional regulator n=1 Tax=Phytoactinopolyspora halophila TaxID=1981511 RepID=A0A329R5H0_9ACTN|nr:MarR family transcriptional regulator [Phytoactinopolyspora halophila]AYY12044.1 MarR family transcriptional regulator [Actinobacteria bacterium YIM 96077]RAW18722.1 MarR family transcriptional regulator [Phytoactinopolyspora halophila]
MGIMFGFDERISPEQLRVWRAFERAYGRVSEQLEADLVELHRLPLAWYEVLARLSEAEGHKLRMSQLADMVMLSPSGLSRLVDRMIKEGLIRRIPVEKDARGFYAILAEPGRKRLEEATGTHHRGVLDYMISRFNDEELAQFTAFLERLHD